MSDRLSDTINVGVADIFWYPENSETPESPIYLGITKDGATFKYETEWHEITSDQTGTTPLDDIKIGEKVTAEFNLLDTSKRKIYLTMPTASTTITKENNSSDSKEHLAVTFGDRAGLRATHYSGKLRIHPVSMGGDKSNDIIIYRTANTGNLELAYKLDDEWVIPCVFKGYYDETRNPNDQLFRIGEEYPRTEPYEGRAVDFWITPSNGEIETHSTLNFGAKAMMEDYTSKDVTDKCKWSSSNEDVFKFNENSNTGTAINTGKSIIKAVCNDIGWECNTLVVVK